MANLYQKLATPDRSKTQLSYAANYLTSFALPDEARKLIAWKKKKVMRKSELVAILSEDMDTLSFTPFGKEEQQWQIHWEFNSIPTQLEWERKSDKYLMLVEFRVLCGAGKIVILSF